VVELGAWSSVLSQTARVRAVAGGCYIWSPGYHGLHVDCQAGCSCVLPGLRQQHLGAAEVHTAAKQLVTLLQQVVNSFQIVTMRSKPDECPLSLSGLSYGSLA
jgi:hypothetical protein